MISGGGFWTITGIPLGPTWTRLDGCCLSESRALGASGCLERTIEAVTPAPTTAPTANTTACASFEAMYKASATCDQRKRLESLVSNKPRVVLGSKICQYLLKALLALFVISDLWWIQLYIQGTCRVRTVLARIILCYNVSHLVTGHQHQIRYLNTVRGHRAQSLLASRRHF